MKANNIYCGDSFKMTPLLDDGSIDLIVCDGPYGVRDNCWDKIAHIQEYNLNLIQLFAPKMKDGGALYLFGKANCIDFVDYRPYLSLRSKIVWYQPSRLAQGRINFTNNYDVVCYFVKGKTPKTFNLDAIRVPQLVELAHRKRCEAVPSVRNGKFGATKFSDKGKNPGNVWGDIKQLTYKSKELLSKEVLNTIQKPEKLIERIIRASSNENDLVFDPFSGVGTCPAVCKKLNRNFIAFEIDEAYVATARNRIKNIPAHNDSD